MVCGIDEAGRGPLAGPVVAAAAVLGSDFPLEFLADSKRLSAARRERAFGLILERAVAWGIGWASPQEIDERNILNASLLAMTRAYDRLGMRPETVFVDGNSCPGLGRTSIAVIKGDSIVPAIMAASILAKVARDRMMERYDWLYPEYGYARHKGYPTQEHRELCRSIGPSPIQRSSFRY